MSVSLALAIPSANGAERPERIGKKIKRVAGITVLVLAPSVLAAGILATARLHEAHEETMSPFDGKKPEIANMEVYLDAQAREGGATADARLRDFERRLSRWKHKYAREATDLLPTAESVTPSGQQPGPNEWMYAALSHLAYGPDEASLQLLDLAILADGQIVNGYFKDQDLTEIEKTLESFSPDPYAFITTSEGKWALKLGSPIEGETTAHRMKTVGRQTDQLGDSLGKVRANMKELGRKWTEMLNAFHGSN